ncbi:protein Dok-7 [Scomber japonicus]|uniref:protein Dok-7 n=1 Tax=Scomber japonicus TaxID=13676 RepID=UPI0023062B46|nr:protein Dok-7 [Scomber japonicus]
MTDTVVAEGQVKFRDGKKWKSRWVVLRKPSPVADCLSLLVYKEKKKGKEKSSGHKERLNVTLEGICGVEPGTGFDGVSYTLSILCLAHTLVLGFHSRDALLAWDARIRYSLGEVHRFSVDVELGTKLESGPASLHLCNNLLVLTRGLPPIVIGHWKLSALRRYGAVPNGFVFEGGTRCGYWAGVFFLSCSDGEQISFLFDCIVRGINPSRVPHGLRPTLPDPNADPASAEKRIDQEASDLEKRLSMLSQCSLASSTASTYSCSTSVAGDDHSISSSSSSQSDTSYGSRLPFWVEPLARPHPSNETASSSSTLKALASSDDRLYAVASGSSGIRPSSAQLHTRGLHDSGRQSSLDSGIGIAAGSQSSYSGSFSSYTGSLDMASQGGGEDFGSLASLPAPPLPPSSPPFAAPSTPLPPPASPLFALPSTPLPPPSSPLFALPSTPLPPPSSPVFAPPSSPPPPPSSPLFSPPSTPPPPSILTPEHSSATSSSSTPCASRCSSCASRRHSEEYQIPSLLRLLYDTPRSLFQNLTLREPSAQGGLLGLGRDSRSSGDEGQRLTNSPTGSRAQHQAMMQRSLSWGSERAPSVDSEGRSTPRSPPVPGGDTQCSHGEDNYITPEQWRSAKSRCFTQVDSSSSGPSPSADTPGAVCSDPPLCVREEHGDRGDVGYKFAGLRRWLPSFSHSGPPPLPVTLSTRSPTAPCGVFQSHSEAPPSAPLGTGLRSDSTANYVNIPISLLPARSDRELLYTELDLQEPSSAAVSSPHSAKHISSVFSPNAQPEEGSIRYAHLDIAAMETAQRVGAEHVQGRQDRLTELESRRRGPPI